MRRAVPLLIAVAAFVLGVCVPSLRSQPADVERGGALPGPFPLFPSDNWWNLDISEAPLDVASSAHIGFINANGRRRLHPDMGGDTGLTPPDPLTYGMPYVVVPGTQPLVPVVFQYEEESDHQAPGRPPGYPIPDQAKSQPRWIEGGLPGGGNSGDRHMLLVDRDHRMLYELFALSWNGGAQRWEAGSGAIFPLDTNHRRPDTWTSADAAGLAILPGLIRYDEVYASQPIRHAFRVTVRSTNGYVYPASHRAGSTPGALPMGARLRLKAGKSLAGYPAPLQRIFQAMKTYGLIVADNGSDMFITGTYDTRWDMDLMLSGFRSLYADDFEVVRLGWNPESADTDGDGLPDGWESRYGLDPALGSGADGASGDVDGDGRTNLQEYRNDTHPRGFHQQYFAEGVTSSFFQTSLALANPSARAASVLCRFLPASGRRTSRWLTVPPNASATLDAATVDDLGTAEFSTVVESDVPIVADRTVVWDRDGYGAHSETGISAPRRSWFLAEGATHSGFELFYLLENPESSPSRARVTFLRPPPHPPIVREYVVAGESRVTVWVDVIDPGLAATDVSGVVEVLSGAPIIVERAMYLDAGGRRFGAGHDSAAVPAPALQWFFAEGATGPYFDLFILLANPAEGAADVEMTYLLPSGTTVSRRHRVPPRSRANVWVDLEAAELADTAVSTVVRSLNGVPIVAERAMWWPGPTAASWHEAHAAAGSIADGLEWALADGYVGGPSGAETYVLVANVSGAAGDADVRLLFQDGTPGVTRRFRLPPNSRTNVDVRAHFPQALDKRFGVLVTSPGPSPARLVVERAVYWDALGERWAAGTSALATKLR